MREIIDPPASVIPALVDELEAVREEINKIKAQHRGAGRQLRTQLAPLQERARELRNELREARAKARETRKAVAAAHKDTLDRLEAQRRAAVKQAMHESGLWWVNYEEVRDAYERARQRMLAKRRQGEKAELHFHRFDGTGKVTIRYQTGLPVAKVFEQTDTRLQIAPVSGDAWANPVRAVRRKLARTMVRIRVTSENRRPVWVELPMVMHRHLPEDGDIRSASIVRERVGRRWRYKLIVAVAAPAHPRRWPGKRSGAIGIDLGWRMVADGLRVAYWADDQGRHGHLVLPPEVLYEFAKLPDLRSIRDKHFNEVKADLSKWRDGRKLPDWLREELANLHAWKSPGRLMSLVAKWADSRVPGDEEIWARLQEWRRRENHLYDWEANLRDQVRRRRREIYRRFAAWVAQNYAAVALESMDLAGLARKRAPEDGTKTALPPDRQRVIAAVSELRLAIENVCRREGVDVRRVESKWSTMECHACGHTERFDAAKQIWRTCPKCGELWDQDHNAARVILSRLLSQMQPGLTQEADLRNTKVSATSEIPVAPGS